MEKSSQTTRQVLAAALSMALVFSILDVCIGISSTELQFPLFRTILLPLAVSTAFFLAAFALLWFLAGARIADRFGAEKIPAAIALGVFIGVVMLLVSLNYKTFNTKGVGYGWELAVFLLIAAAASILSYYAAKKIRLSRSGGVVGPLLAILLPVLLAEAMILMWLMRHSEYTGYELSWAYFVTLLLTAAIFVGFVKSKFDPIIPLAVLALTAIVVSPIAFVLTEKSYEPDASRYETYSEHDLKHVILITVDTLRRDVLSSYGSTDVKTPNIDSVAADGVLFENAFSAAPWTLPSFSSIMTGLPPTVHKTTRAESMLPDEFTTMAEYLRDSGYYTTAIGDNFFLHPEYNMDQGFIEYNFYPRRRTTIDSFGATLINRAFPGNLKYYISTKELTDIALEWLDANSDRDFFLWVHYYDPHIPYAPPWEYISKDAQKDPSIGYMFESARDIRSGHFSPGASQREWIKELYDAEVRYVDHELGRLLEALKEKGLYDDSLVILTSDHGEEFWDHDGFEHGHTLYNEVIQVPLIIKTPGASGAVRLGDAVGTASIMPTVMDSAGIDYERNEMMADSLTPLLGSDKAAFAGEPLISTGLLYYENRESVIFDGNKLIRSLVTGREELYDLGQDPGELNPLPHPQNFTTLNRAEEILAEKKDKAEEFGREIGVTESRKVELDKEKKEKLKALNYLQ